MEVKLPKPGDQLPSVGLFEKLHEFLRSCPDSDYGGYSRVTLTASKGGGLKIDLSFQPYGHAKAKGATMEALFKNLLASLRESRERLDEFAKTDAFFAQRDATKLNECIALVESQIAAVAPTEGGEE